MPAVKVKPRPAAKKTTTKQPARTKPRVEDTEPKGTTRKSAVHRGEAQVEAIGADMIRVTGQGSELVPVAQYASVTIGPVAVQMQFHVPFDTAVLAGIDWSDDPDAETEMTEEEREAFEFVVGCAMSTQRVVDTVVSRDRAIVEESVRLYNKRKADEEEEAKKSSGSRKRS
jgi:hypothetical protein